MNFPVIPDPTTATIHALQDSCRTVRLWADTCDDIPTAYEAHARVTAIETYLATRGLDGPAQEAARWLEVRIGELLGPAHPGKELPHEVTLIPANRRHDFRLLAGHRDLVTEHGPIARHRILKIIRQLEAANKPSTNGDQPHDTTPDTFTTIVIDPPWRYTNIATRGAAEDHYPTMTLRELEDLELPAAPNSHLYLWVTNAFVSQGFDLLVSWGFTYKTILTWCKPSIGMGNYFRNNTEHVLFAIKGNLPTQRNDLGTWFQAAKTRHSAKPDSFYDIVETSSPGPWLEMFARRRRMGWHVWGNEA